MWVAQVEGQGPCKAWQSNFWGEVVLLLQPREAATVRFFSNSRTFV